MDMSFKGVDNETAAYIHSYRVLHNHKTLTDALVAIVRDHKHDVDNGNSKYVETKSGASDSDD